MADGSTCGTWGPCCEGEAIGSPDLFVRSSTTPGSIGALEEDLGEVFDKAFNLLIAKHRNYGPGNIADAPGGPLNGLRVRLHDKQARWNHMLDNEIADAVGEDLEETFLDALNYCAIAILVLRGQWPGTES